VIDRFVASVSFADKSNIKRQKPLQDRRCGTNVCFIPYETAQSKAEKFDHPAGFPVELPARCIKLHGVRPDLLVVDPFFGAALWSRLRHSDAEASASRLTLNTARPQYAG
jgi:site-specific DNA-methyltransferase (adenine-specific)